jgi:2-oxoglutarate ferredoxin oxidoreductase subunit delta
LHRIANLNLLSQSNPQTDLSMPKRKKKNSSPSIPEQNPDNYWETKQNLKKKGKKLFTQQIYEDWCKACGICIALCPTEVFEKSETGTPIIKNPDACTGCRFCEFHCPDFAISIQEKFPDRRKKKNDT